jgi:chemosensory pili system protein ChpA (sensor histidine kinase/response regulator)
VLLPLLNDLRAARGQKLLSENVMFDPDVAAPLPVSPAAAKDVDCAALARKLRHHYQTGLLAVFRNQAAAGGLGVMNNVVTKLENASHFDASLRLWWVTGGLIEALADGGLQANTAVKQLLGEVDRRIKQLIDQGEATFSEKPPRDLIRNQLYYIAHAGSTGTRVTDVKQAFTLDRYVHKDDDITKAREALGGRNTQLLQTVAVAIKEDLARIKDGIDLYVRNDKHEPEALQRITSVMQQVGDTLGMLGLGMPRKHVIEQVKVFNTLAESGRQPGEKALMEIASTLLHVESALEDLGSGRGLGSDESDSAHAAAGDADFQQVVGVVIREAVNDIAAVKDAVVQFTNTSWDHSSLAEVPHLLTQIAGGIQMLSMNNAAALVGAIGNYVSQSLIEAKVEPREDELNHLADAISSIEYYLEGARQDRVNRNTVLDKARRSLEALGYPVAVQPEPVAEAAVAAPESSQDFAIETDAVESVMPVDAPASETAVAAPAPVAAAPAAPSKPIAEDLDDEILEIFIEESNEELENLRANVPAWIGNPDDREPLTVARRSFHTLKGSGRLVGALTIGEFAWAYENMLNRVLDDTIAPSDELFGLLNGAIEALPQLIEHLTRGTAPTMNVQALMEHAQALSRGETFTPPADMPAAEDDPPVAVQDSEAVGTDDPGDQGVIEAADTESPIAEEAAVEEFTMDPVLYEIFSMESAGHLHQIQDFIEQCRAQQAGCVATPGLVRALHTLHGSAHMAGAERVAELGSALEHYFKDLLDHQALIPADALEALSDSADTFSALLATLNVADAPNIDTAPLCARIDGLRAQVESLPAAPAEVVAACGGATVDHNADTEYEGYPVVEDAVTQEAMPTDQVVAAISDAAPNDATVATGTLDVVPGEAGPEQAVASDAVQADDEPDDELLEIFLEEGEEVLAASDDILQRWMAAPDDTSLVEELQRQLHTLKGGARMANLKAIGDLSHSVESLMVAVVDGRVKPSNRMFDALHMAQDRLVGYLEQARAYEPMLPASELLEEFEVLFKAKKGGRKAKPQEDRAAVESPDEPLETSEADTGPAGDALLPREADVISLREDRRAVARTAGEQVRVRADLLDNLVNYAGEVSIYRARLEQQVGSFSFNLVELEQTVSRLREQLRKLEIETEAQILFRYEEAGGDHVEDFDPLELDRFSHMQQLSRSLMESVSDMSSLQSLFHNLSRESETLLLQQSRVVTELQEGLMRTRMVPFAGLAPRLRRIVRQTCHELDKRCELQLKGAEGEMDRTVIDRIVAPLEHMLRNAISHGVESPALRRKLGKHEVGRILIDLSREGSEVVIRVSDDGAGLNLDAIRRKAQERGLIKDAAGLTDNDIMQFILEAGFSTASEVTQISGRGVGMDVVNSEIKQLGGSLHIDSSAGKGTMFSIRLPFTLAINQALLVQAGEDTYAIPLSSIEGIVRMPIDEVRAFHKGMQTHYSYAGNEYQYLHLAMLLDATSQPHGEAKKVPVLMVRSGDHRAAFEVDSLLGSREIVVKSVGPQISTVRGVSGATILADGRVVLILDVSALVRKAVSQQFSFQKLAMQPAKRETSAGLTVMVVDDSITVRKVTTRLLERNNMNVITAKDGVDAVALLQEHIPDLMLLDIEMPRMDGYELATHMRNEPRLKDIPIIMITSRTGDKHRQRAMEIGVNRYLGKPFQESELLAEIMELSGVRAGHA